jgi:hypothetical protein
VTLTAQVLTDVRIYLETADLTGWGNKIDVQASVADEDKTNFASGGWKERAGGLFDTTCGIDGFWEALDASRPDDAWWAQLGQNQVALTVAPTSGAVGTLAYLTRGIASDYKQTGNMGKILAWSASVKGNWPLVRGQIMHPQGTPRTATGTGTGFQLGALSAAQRMYCCLHVLSISGTATPTITVTLQSNVDNTFAAPTNRITFLADTALDGQALSVLGPVTDTWWRAIWTISGTTPSFLFAVSAGIGLK